MQQTDLIIEPLTNVALLHLDNTEDFTKAKILELKRLVGDEYRVKRKGKRRVIIHLVKGIVTNEEFDFEVEKIKQIVNG